jgi:hypothetical protein
MAELSQKQLEEIVEGKPEKARATFYEKAALDVGESKKHGYRVYRPTVYVKLIQAGITDNISYTAKAEDLELYAEEYAYFLSNRQGVKRSVMIDIIPKLDIIHMQELIDMGLSTIDRLAGAESVPPHLEYARQSAVTLNRVLQEQANVQHEESNIEESNIEEAEFKEIPVPTKNVHEAHRQSHSDDVRQPDVQASDERGRVNDPERLRPSRPQHDTSKTSDRRRIVLPSTDWNISFG